MNRTFKIAIIASILVYSCGILFTYYSNLKFEERVAFYDTDNNGLIEGEELTKNAVVTAKLMTKRKTTNEAYIMLIPIALLFGLFIAGIAYLLKKMKSIDDNEIDYSKRK